MSKSGESLEQLNALLELASRGDLAAFEEFYSLSANWALHLVRQLADEAQVEALTTQLYVMAWMEVASYDRSRMTATEWLTGLARRLERPPA